MAALAPRLLVAALAALLAAGAAFLLVHAAPGALLTGESGAAGMEGELRGALGLDAKLWERWLAWLGAALRGDLGWSWRNGAPVLDVVLERLPVTLALMLPAILLAGAGGVALGALAAGLPPGRARVFAAAMNGVHALPVFVVAQLGVMALAVWLGLLPVQGLGEGEWMRHLALPVLSLAIHQMCLMALLARGGLAEELARPYAVAARARGCSRAAVRWRHALPNAAAPLVALMGARVGALVGGSVVVETAFGLPGLGRLAVTAALGRDHALVVGVVLLASVVTVVANLLTDGLLRRVWRARA